MLTDMEAAHLKLTNIWGYTEVKSNFFSRFDNLPLHNGKGNTPTKRGCFGKKKVKKEDPGGDTARAFLRQYAGRHRCSVASTKGRNYVLVKMICTLF